MRSILTYYVVVLFGLSSCAQTKEKTMNTTVEKDPITINNVVEKMWQAMPKYNEQPMYLLRINQEYCTYEVLVNDFPIYKNYDQGILATPIKINRAILKSGEQTVTIRMYPFGDLLQEAFGDEEPYFDTLEGGSSVQVRLLKVNNWKNYPQADEHLVKIVKTEGFDNNKFPGEGLPFYEFSFSFTAEVPYEFEGWSNGIDLREIDSTILRKTIWDYFKMYQNILENRDTDSDAKVYYNLFVREAQSEYWDKEKTERVCNELKRISKIEDKEFQPLKNYELAFYGGGRIATFKHSSGLDIDPRLRGNPALYFLYDNQNRVIFNGLYLFMPKNKYNGKEEDLQLEMIK